MNKDKVFLNHILDEIDFLDNQFKDLDFQDLMKDYVLQRACVRSLEVIGEAVKNLSENLKRKYPDAEWKTIAGLRDKLIHHYFGIDWDIVWDIIKNKIPNLEEDIKTLIES